MPKRAILNDLLNENNEVNRILSFFIINNRLNGTPGKLCAHVEIFPS